MLIGRSRYPASRDASTSLRIDLLRHGEVEGGSRFRGHTDDPLTTIGLQQMHVAANAHCWDRLISSPLVRCAAFAQEYSQRFSIPHTFDPRLMEIDFGAWEGCSAAELMESSADALSRFWNDPLLNTPPDGEPLLQFQARVLDAWHDIIMNHDGQQTLIVTHGGVIRVLLCQLLNQPLTQLQTFDVGYGCIYRIQVDNAGQASICDTARGI